MCGACVCHVVCVYGVYVVCVCGVCVGVFHVGNTHELMPNYIVHALAGIL